MSEKRFLQNAYEARTTDEMREYYDRWAEVYDTELTENEYQQPRRCAAALAQVLANRSARILDAGCGTGLSGLALVETGFHHIDGCDFSKPMLEKAFETGIYGKLFIADLNRPPLDTPDETYDAVTAVGVFSYGHVNADAIEEFLRVCRPGAPIVIGMNNHYYREGLVTGKLQRLEREKSVEIISEEHGEHIPGTGLTGWVITARKPEQGL